MAAPPESALAVHEPACEPDAPTGEPTALLGKLPIRCRLGEGDDAGAPVRPPPPRRTVPAGHVALAATEFPGVVGPATDVATTRVEPSGPPSAQRANCRDCAPESAWPPAARMAVHEAGQAPEAAGLPAASLGTVPIRRRLGDTAPPATRSPRAPPLTIRVPAEHVADAVVCVPAAPGPAAGTPATTRVRRPGPAGVGPGPGPAGVEPEACPGVPAGPVVAPGEPPAAPADVPPPFAFPAAVAPVLPATPGVVLRWAGLVLSPSPPPTAVADGVTVLDAPGEVVEVVEVTSAWLVLVGD